MPNLMQRGASWLGGKQKTASGRTVKYRRGAIAATVTMWPHERRDTVIGEDGIATQVDDYDWTIEADDLVLNGQRVEPQDGDVIEETLNSKTIQWAVSPPAQDKQCWEWLDSAGVLFLVHTKRVK